MKITKEPSMRYHKGSYSNMSLSERQEVIDNIVNDNLGYNINDDPCVIEFVRDMTHNIDNISNEYFDMFYSLFARTAGFNMCLVDIEGDDIDEVNDIKISTDKKYIILIVENYYDDGQIDEFIVPIKYIDDKLVRKDMISKLTEEYDILVNKLNEVSKHLETLQNNAKEFKDKLDGINNNESYINLK